MALLSELATSETVTSNHLLVILDGSDASYLRTCSNVFNKYFGTVTARHCGSMSIPAFAKLLRSKGVTHVLTSSMRFMSQLQPNIEGADKDNYGLKLIVSGIPVVMIPPLKQVYTVPSGNFMLHRWCKKAVGGYKDFISKDAFTWKMLDRDSLDSALKLAAKAWLCSVDIETGESKYRVITSVAYTFVVGLRTFTYVIPFKEGSDIAWKHKAMQILNDTAVPKVMQNGLYDSVYFLRFNAPLRNYIYDTYHMMHCMYPELGKKLHEISSFFLDDFMYWKEESKRNLYEYNAKDTHNTAWVWIAQMLHMRYEAPWAKKNFVHEMPVVYPALLGELEGIKVNEPELLRLRAEYVDAAVEPLARLQKLLGIPNFNPNSPKQTKAMFNALGVRHNKEFDSTNKVNTQRFLELDPLHLRLVECLREFRKRKKAVATYFNPEKVWNGRLHYKLDPAGTETGRLSSKESSFWCGHNEQNIPPYAKSMYEADEGFELFEVDKSQAESWCTGYLSGDRNLLNVLHTSPDFHCSNASLFFGIPFEELFDTATGQKLNKPIRDLAKRTNHGANYNMGAQVLWDTMGTENLVMAAKLLKLPPYWAPIEIAHYLLECFDRAYPTIRDTSNGYYARLIKEIRDTGCLVGPTGWTRRTFLDPRRSKSELNTICAHPSQSLSVLLVNKAWVKCLDMQLRKYPQDLRLKAQNHDSIFGQVRIGRKDIVEEIEQVMRVPVTVRGKVLTIPGDVGPIGKRWIDIKD